MVTRQFAVKKIFRNIREEEDVGVDEYNNRKGLNYYFSNDKIVSILFNSSLEFFIIWEEDGTLIRKHVGSFTNNNITRIVDVVELYFNFFCNVCCIKEQLLDLKIDFTVVQDTSMCLNTLTLQSIPRVVIQISTIDLPKIISFKLNPGQDVLLEIKGDGVYVDIGNKEWKQEEKKISDGFIRNVLEMII